MLLAWRPKRDRQKQIPRFDGMTAPRLNCKGSNGYSTLAPLGRFLSGQKVDQNVSIG